MLTLIDINGLTLADFLGQEWIKEVCFLFILAESMLTNTTKRDLLLQTISDLKGRFQVKPLSATGNSYGFNKMV